MWEQAFPAMGESQLHRGLATNPGQPIELAPFETRMISGTDLEDLGWEASWPDDFTVAGVSQKEMDRLILNRTIPEGQYQLCFELFDWDTDGVILQSCSDNFEVLFAVAPVIVNPEDMETFTSVYEPVFVQWLPVYTGGGLAVSNIEYGLQVLELDSTDREFGDSYVNQLFEARDQCCL